LRDARRRVHVAHLEGMAAIGRVRRFWTEDCGSAKRRRVVAELENGEVVETRCTDHRGVKKIVMYLAEASRLSGVVVSGQHVDFEEVFEDEGDEQG